MELLNSVYMKSMPLIVILFLLAGTVVWADDNDPVSAVEGMLNPGLRFKLYERQAPGVEMYGLRTLKGTYTTSKGVKSFAIDDLVAEHRLIIDIDEKGKATPRLAPLVQDNHDQGELPITVSLNDGKFDQTDQSLEKRLKADTGVPKVVVFGVYWDRDPTGIGADAVEYTIAFRTDPSGPITVITCRHDLRGTALAAPLEAAADVAAGALIADVNRLQLLIYETATMLDSAKDSAAKNTTLTILQPLMDADITEIDKLSHHTKGANSIVADKAKTILAQSDGFAMALRKLRDPKVAGTYSKEGENKKIDEILTIWERDGIPFTATDK